MYFKDKENKIFHLQDNCLDKKRDDWVEISENEMKEITLKASIGTLEQEKFYAKNRIMFDFSTEINQPLELNGLKYQIKEGDLIYFETLFNGADEIDFILADNSVTKLNKADFDELKIMLTKRRNDLTLKLRDLKNQIEKAENTQTLKEIKWL